MAIFDFLKKKKKSLPLPPPPSPPEGLKGDFEPIKPAPAVPQEFQFTPEQQLPPPIPQQVKQPELPEFPEVPKFEPAELETYELPRQVPQAPQPEVPQREEYFEYHEPEAPVQRTVPPKSFIALDDYRNIISEANQIRSHLVNADTYVRKLTDLKNKEEGFLERWRDQLDKLEKKMTYVDELIASAKR